MSEESKRPSQPNATGPSEVPANAAGASDADAKTVKATEANTAAESADVVTTTVSEPEPEAPAVIARSPIHESLSALGAVWKTFGGAEWTVSITDLESEKAAFAELAICDVSPLARLLIKGPGAESWMQRQGLSPARSVMMGADAPRGGKILRTGGDEFVVEAGVSGEPVATMLELEPPHDALILPKPDACFLLAGRRRLEVMKQVAGVDFSKAGIGHVIFTRAAGVSVCMMPLTVSSVPALRIWCDPSMGRDLWSSLTTILSELGGRIVGAGCVFPSLVQ